MRERQHQGGIAARNDGHPCGFSRRIATLWPDVDQFHAVLAELAEPVGRLMAGDTAHADLRVLWIDAAEHDQQFCMLGNHWPAVLFAPRHLEEVHAKDMRDDRLRSTGAVARIRRGVAADAVQEAMDLAERVMKPAGAGPAIRATKNGTVAVRRAHAIEFLGCDVECLVPRQLNEVVGAALVPCPVSPALQPAPTERGARDAGAMLHRRRHGMRNRRWCRVGLERRDIDDAVVFRRDGERPPMARGDFGLFGGHALHSTCRLPASACRSGRAVHNIFRPRL